MFRKLAVGSALAALAFLVVYATNATFQFSKAMTAQAVKSVHTSNPATEVWQDMNLVVRTPYDKEIVAIDLGSEVQNIVPQWDYACADYGNRPDADGVGRWSYQNGQLVLQPNENQEPGICNYEGYLITIVWADGEVENFKVDLHVEIGK